MGWLDLLISILLFIISLSLLVCIHEAGHLSMAKLFKVYCREYSIGFGPAIIHKRKEGKETYFSIRAIPFGGYVSMYGEEGVDTEENVPAERSLEGVKKWKKGIIVSAGIILNAVLALILLTISDIALPLKGYTRTAIVEENSLVALAGVQNGDSIEYVYSESQTDEDGIYPFEYYYSDSEKVIHAGNFFIVDPNIVMNESEHYVLAFMFAGNKKEPIFADGLLLYEAIEKENLVTNTYVNEVFGSWANEENSPQYYPDFTKGTVKLTTYTQFDANILFTLNNSEEKQTRTIHFSTVKSGNSYVFKDIGLKFEIRKYYAPFKERVKATFVDYGNASVAVFKGIGELFKSGLKNMSGVVGIFETSANLYTNYTFSTYLYFWALISVNLAIFNLLPFPGLDGWQLLVTIVEGISKKKIPTKVKSIVSFIGLSLLMLLMVAVVFMDILKIVG